MNLSDRIKVFTPATEASVPLDTPYDWLKARGHRMVNGDYFMRQGFDEEGAVVFLVPYVGDKESRVIWLFPPELASVATIFKLTFG